MLSPFHLLGSKARILQTLGVSPSAGRGIMCLYLSLALSLCLRGYGDCESNVLEYEYGEWDCAKCLGRSPERMRAGRTTSHGSLATGSQGTNWYLTSSRLRCPSPVPHVPHVTPQPQQIQGSHVRPRGSSHQSRQPAMLPPSTSLPSVSIGSTASTAAPLH